MDDGDGTRGDRFEGSLFYYSDPSNLSISFDRGRLTLPGTDLACSPQATRNQTMWNHVYCMSALHSGDWDAIPADRFDEFVESIRFDKRLIGLGGYAVVVVNVSTFLERLDQFSVSKASSYKCGLVEYYDESSFNGSFEPGREVFMKSSRFAYQHEYRFAMDFGPYESCPPPRIIDIGDLSDISSIVPTADLNRELKLVAPKG